MTGKDTEYTTSVVELIKRRVAWRNYLRKDVEESKIEKIDNFMANLEPPPFLSEIRFKIVHDSLDGKKTVPGTYGFIKRAETFMAGAVVKNEKDMEDFGYLFEKIILYATDLNLSTCWIGGFFNRSSFGEKLGITADEIIPAVSPLGYPAKRRALLDSIMYHSIRAKDRKPWKVLFFSENMNSPLHSDQVNEYATPLELLRLSPSSCNRQPWRIVYKNGFFHFFLYREDWYKKLFELDLQRIDMGIAMCHFELTAKSSGLSGEWVIMDADIRPLPAMHEYVASWKNN